MLLGPRPAPLVVTDPARVCPFAESVGDGDAAVHSRTRPSQCRLRNFHRGSPRVLHAPRSRAHPRPRSSTLRIHRIGRARRVVDRLESPVRYVRQFPFTTSFRPSLLTWPRPFHPDFHSGPPAAPTTCRPGTPSTEQCPPPIPNTSLAGRLAGWLPVPSSALGGLPAAARWRLLAPHGCHLASHGFALASVEVWSPAPRSPTDHGHGQRPPQQHQPETASAPVTHRTLLCLRTRDATPPSRQASAVSLHPFLLSDSCSLRCRLRPFDGR